MPANARLWRLGPSKANGLVTIPTVRAPNSFEILAIAGAAPLPVPPPIPAVIKTMSEFSNVLVMTSLFSSTAC